METLALMIKEVNKELGDSKITPEKVARPLINSWKKKTIFQGVLVAASFPLTHNRGQEDS